MYFDFESILDGHLTTESKIMTTFKIISKISSSRSTKLKNFSTTSVFPTTSVSQTSSGSDRFITSFSQFSTKNRTTKQNNLYPHLYNISGSLFLSYSNITSSILNSNSTPQNQLDIRIEVNPIFIIVFVIMIIVSIGIFSGITCFVVKIFQLERKNQTDLVKQQQTQILNGCIEPENIIVNELKSSISSRIFNDESIDINKNMYTISPSKTTFSFKSTFWDLKDYVSKSKTFSFGELSN